MSAGSPSLQIPDMSKSAVLWKTVNWAIIVALAAMVVIVFVNAFLRYALNSGIPAGEELSRYLFVWVCALGSIVAYKEGKHIGVDLLTATLKGKPRVVVLVLGQLVVIGAFLLVLWGGWEYFLTSAASPGPATDIPFGFVSVSILIVAAAITVMAVQECVRLVRDHSMPDTAATGRSGPRKPE